MLITENRVYLEEYLVKKGFNAPDLQTELIKELSPKLELLKQEFPELNFPALLDKAHDAYGLFGFDSRAQLITKQISARYWKLFLAFVVQTLIKQWFVCVLFLILMFFLQKVYGESAFYSTFFTLFLLLLGLLIKQSFMYMKLYKHFLNFKYAAQSMIFLPAVFLFIWFGYPFGFLFASNNQLFRVLLACLGLGFLSIYGYAAFLTLKAGIIRCSSLSQ